MHDNVLVTVPVIGASRHGAGIGVLLGTGLEFLSHSLRQPVANQPDEGCDRVDRGAVSGRTWPLEVASIDIFRGQAGTPVGSIFRELFLLAI